MGRAKTEAMDLEMEMGVKENGRRMKGRDMGQNVENVWWNCDGDVVRGRGRDLKQGEEIRENDLKEGKESEQRKEVGRRWVFPFSRERQSLSTPSFSQGWPWEQSPMGCGLRRKKKFKSLHHTGPGNGLCWHVVHTWRPDCNMPPLCSTVPNDLQMTQKRFSVKQDLRSEQKNSGSERTRKISEPIPPSPVFARERIVFSSDCNPNWS